MIMMRTLCVRNAVELFCLLLFLLVVVQSAVYRLDKMVYMQPPPLPTYIPPSKKKLPKLHTLCYSHTSCKLNNIYRSIHLRQMLESYVLASQFTFRNIYVYKNSFKHVQSERFHFIDSSHCQIWANDYYMVPTYNDFPKINVMEEPCVYWKYYLHIFFKDNSGAFLAMFL